VGQCWFAKAGGTIHGGTQMKSFKGNCTRKNNYNVAGRHPAAAVHVRFAPKSGSHSPTVIYVSRTHLQAQESLQNIVKHAQADQVEVLLSYQSEHTLLKVKDYGIKPLAPADKQRV
jgi:hypothetical protein